MNNVITVTFDGQVLKPINTLNWEINKQYKIQLISDLDDLSLSDENSAENQENSDILDELHQEFNWLVADLGVNEPLTRDKGYEK
jgi:hypothetical protein